MLYTFLCAVIVVCYGCCMLHDVCWLCMLRLLIKSILYAAAAAVAANYTLYVDVCCRLVLYKVGKIDVL